MVEWAVPAFRLPDEIRKSEFKRLITPLTTVRTGASAKPAVKLLDEGFDAVFIATGLQASAKAGLPGEESARFALDFLDAANAGILDCSGKRVLVVGGGNVAMDVCGTAVRTGAASVEIACMEALNEMPSCKSEIDETVGEGVVFHNRVLPKEIVVDNGSVKGLKCVSITWREPGKYVPSNAEEIPGTERFIPADILVEAIGQRPETDVDELFRGIDRERGLVRADGDTMRTNVENIYAGGDIVSGGSTVVEAVYHGNKAAAAIVETLNASD
ncbi:MAG: FAD-dependent oxidoreductase [Victivallales bacterium]|nr:FAD-dependent oxidoreductase [Victivallales bacterium]